MSAIRRLLPFLAGLLAGAFFPCAHAQGPVEPAHADILAYVRVFDPPRQVERLAAAARGAGVPFDAVSLFRSLAMQMLGDQYAVLPRSGQPLTVAWVRQGDGPVRFVHVLPPVADRRYLADCADIVSMRVVEVENVPLMTPKDLPDWPSAEVLAALKDLHEAVHPVDLIAYMRGEMLALLTDPTTNALEVLRAPIHRPAPENPWDIPDTPAPTATPDDAQVALSPVRILHAAAAQVAWVALQPDPRPDPEQIKREGWRDQQNLVISPDDTRLDWVERELLRRIGDRLYGPKERRHG